MKFGKYILVLLLFSSLISASYAKMTCVVVPKANLREGPGEKYPIKWSIRKHTPLQIIKEKRNWLQVKDFEGEVSWIFKKLTRPKNYIIIKTAKPPVREKPDMESRILWQAKKGQIYPVLGKIRTKVFKTEDAWLKVQGVNKKFGWIYSQLVWGIY